MIYVLICLSRVSTHPSDMLLGKIGLIFKMKSINSNSVKRNVKNYFMCITNKKKLNKSIRILHCLKKHGWLLLSERSSILRDKTKYQSEVPSIDHGETYNQRFQILNLV